MCQTMLQLCMAQLTVQCSRAIQDPWLQVKLRKGQAKAFNALWKDIDEDLHATLAPTATSTDIEQDACDDAALGIEPGVRCCIRSRASAVPASDF